GIIDVWRQTKGEGVRVAILDTGIDIDHPDLKDAIVETSDFTGDGIEDESGHGTHCAGIIGARLNSVGFVGVAPSCELLIGKVLNNNGEGALEWVAAGIDWATEKGANIISMSLGGNSSSNKLYESVHSSLASGTCIICAAGNEGSLFRNSIGTPGI
ncbi:MAG: S8 family serine peptidase, partial [Bacteroidetes bacterium]|nr:S8 family serine peptidase [Bacteroidota bacterium]